MVAKLSALLFALAAAAFCAAAAAQTDEIQVYDASIVEVGKFELTVHGNYTPSGLTQADFTGGVVPDHALNGTFEFAYGLADYWELGLYLPVLTRKNDGQWQYDGAKLRSLWVVPEARKREFFYGLNVELSQNSLHWEDTRRALELRPIVGLHEGRWDFIFNPIVDSGFDGVRNAHFAPEERVAYNASEAWAFALESYADLGPLGHFEGWSSQSQSLFAVTDYTVNEANSLEFGVGHGFTHESDALVLKLIWNHAF